MITPILETQRLILRPFHREDARAVLDTWESDPDVARYMFWTSHNDIRKTEAWLDFELSRIEKPDWYRFAIELKASYSLIGTALMYAALRLLYSRIGQPYVGTASYFSFNDPNGMCPECSGIGKVMTIDIEGRIDPEKTGMRVWLICRLFISETGIGSSMRNQDCFHWIKNGRISQKQSVTACFMVLIHLTVPGSAKKWMVFPTICIECSFIGIPPA